MNTKNCTENRNYPKTVISRVSNRTLSIYVNYGGVSKPRGFSCNLYVTNLAGMPSGR